MTRPDIDPPVSTVGGEGNDIGELEWLEGYPMIIQRYFVNGRFVGFMEHHPNQNDPKRWCGGYVGFEVTPLTPAAHHQLVSSHPLTVAPSLQCRSCGHHGFVKSGRWESV